MSKEKCFSNLTSIGFSMGNCGETINVSFNALKKMEVDKIVVTPKVQEKKHVDNDIDINPFILSEGEGTDDDSSLLTHLVREITEVDLDSSDLATRICDLRESSRKSESSSKRAKERKRVNLLKNMLFHERLLLE
jgi:hypothetical protein